MAPKLTPINSPEVYKNIPEEDKLDLTLHDIPGYILIRDERVWSTKTKRFLKKKPNGAIYASVNGKEVSIPYKKLRKKHWNGNHISGVDGKVKDLYDYGFPGYFLTIDGRLWNDVKKQWVASDKRNRYIILNEHGQNKQISVDVLINYVFGDSIYNVPRRDRVVVRPYDNYVVTRGGRIWSWFTYTWLKNKTTKKENDYERVDLVNSRDNTKDTVKIHILVAKAFVSNPYNKPEVNHINGCKHDNSADNLEWVTPDENRRHWKMLKNNEFSKELKRGDYLNNMPRPKTIIKKRVLRRSLKKSLTKQV